MQPKNFEEAAKLNPGRRKFHMRKRQQRADRVLRLLTAMDASKRRTKGVRPAILRFSITRQIPLMISKNRKIAGLT